MTKNLFFKQLELSMVLVEVNGQKKFTKVSKINDEMNNIYEILKNNVSISKIKEITMIPIKNDSNEFFTEQFYLIYVFMLNGFNFEFKHFVLYHNTEDFI